MEKEFFYMGRTSMTLESALHRIDTFEEFEDKFSDDFLSEDLRLQDYLSELVFILDKSGSMHGLEADTVGGFNSMIEKQKGEEGDAFVTSYLFSNDAAMQLFAMEQETPGAGLKLYEENLIDSSFSLSFQPGESDEKLVIIN